MGKAMPCLSLIDGRKARPLPQAVLTTPHTASAISLGEYFAEYERAKYTATRNAAN